MRCPNCSSISHHELTTVEGDPIYHCTRNIYNVQVETRKGEVRFNPNGYPCDTFSKSGKEFRGYVAFVTEGKTKAENLQPRRR